MQELFDEFIESPSRETYLAAREALIDSEAYNPASTEIDIAIGLIEEGKLAEAGAVIAAAEDNLALSPRAHMVLAYLASEAGDEERMEEEGTLAAICCEGIMATGDGSREKPYIPCRVSDEYDVLEFLEKESSDQSIVEDGLRHRRGRTAHRAAPERATRSSTTSPTTWWWARGGHSTWSWSSRRSA